MPHFLLEDSSFLFLILFTYFWLCWVFIAVWAFLQLWQAGATSSFFVRPFYCGGSPCGTQAVGAQASVAVGSQVPQLWHMGLVLCGMWDLPRPGMEPMSPALAGGFFTTESPGKPEGSSCYPFHPYTMSWGPDTICPKPNTNQHQQTQPQI